MSHRRRNRRHLRDGTARRASDCTNGGGRRGERSALLPAIPGTAPTYGPVDAQALAADLARLAALARRGWCT